MSAYYTVQLGEETVTFPKIPVPELLRFISTLPLVDITVQEIEKILEYNWETAAFEIEAYYAKTGLCFYEWVPEEYMDSLVEFDHYQNYLDEHKNETPQQLFSAWYHYAGGVYNEHETEEETSFLL